MEAAIAPSASNPKLQATSVAERRKQVTLPVLLGELPEDFLRLAILPQNTPDTAVATGAPSIGVIPLNDPALIAQQNFIQAQRAFYSFVPPNTRGRISITIVEAKLAKNYGFVRMDPYCRLRVGNTVFETPTNINGGKAPRWDRVINAYLPHGVESIYLQIYDEKSFTMDECIAWAHIVLPSGIFNGETIDDWYQLSGSQGEGKEGVINLIISFTPVQPVSIEQQHLNSQTIPAPPPITDEDVESLHKMFEKLDKDIIRWILEEKRGNKDEAVSAILEMTKD
ncbi:hypothetical protein AB6A40_001291 [Gnathostoma spinigerum]|uniref:Toll-interacting protein n=1 Tax=Gnathostoma spinigerum TaxID=75299 RepID=A0ABD6ED19_9BILA